MYWDHIDRWLDEDVEVFAHLRDPYHRVDIRQTSRQVRVSIGGKLVADTAAAQVLSETGFPNRHYIPAGDVETDRFEKSQTNTHYPYKGDTEYWTSATDDRGKTWLGATPHHSTNR